MVEQRIGRCYCAWIAVVSRLGNFSERKRDGAVSTAWKHKKRSSGDGTGKDHCLFLLCSVACHFVIWKSDCTCHFDVWNGRYDVGAHFHSKLSQLPISHKHTAIFDSLFSR